MSAEQEARLVRPATPDDAEGVASLIAARDLADFGQVATMTPEEVRGWWAEREERLAEHAWVALEDGRVLGYARMRVQGNTADIEDEAGVHPDYRRRGVGAQLVERAEEWARARRLRCIRASVVNDGGRLLLDGRGYRLVRHFWRMEIELSDEPAVPPAPPGLAIRPYRPGADDAELHACLQDAFREEWDFVPEPLERWLGYRYRRDDYHPELWQVAVEGERIVGAALCFGIRDIGWVLELAVGMPWRGRGLGLALLRAGFRELRKRGHTKVGLEVDSENPTGATRLYERAGMRLTRRYDTYEKLL